MYSLGSDEDEPRSNTQHVACERTLPFPQEHSLNKPLAILDNLLN
jgi:hypothetical protein